VLTASLSFNTVLLNDEQIDSFITLLNLGNSISLSKGYYVYIAPMCTLLQNFEMDYALAFARPD